MGTSLDRWKKRLSSAQEPAVDPFEENSKKLAEVRAILERLQHIGAEPDAARADPQSFSAEAPSAEILVARGAGEASVHGARDRKFAAYLQARTLAAMAGVFVIATLALFAFWREADVPPAQNNAASLTPAKPKEGVAALNPPPQVPKAPAAPLDETGRIAEAEKLIEDGKITVARRSLLDSASNSPEAALMLARSYDPNYLRTIVSADAGPDPAEAERWYRAWHVSATSKGLVMEPERLDRIIKAMR